MAGRADGSIYIDTKVNTKGMKTGLNNISSQVSGLGNQLKSIGGLVLKAFAVKKLIEFSKECIDLGSDLQEVQNVVDVTFGHMSGVIEEFSHEAATQFGLSELAAKQYTSTLGAMYKSMGFTTEAATGMSIEMTKLAADMASFYNLDADTAFQKIRSGISGETEPLKQLGINLSEANLEEFRLAEGIETSYRAMSQQDKALLRYNYLLKVTADAQGDFARTSGSWANQVKVLNLQFQSIKANLGQGFINIFTPVLRVINTLLEGLAKVAAAFRAFTELITGQKSSGGTQSITGIDETAGMYDDATDSAEDYADATEDVADATKKAQKANKGYLSGLDDIRRFQTETSSSSSGSSGSGKTPSSSGSSGNTIPIPTFDFGQVNKTETVIDGLAQKMADLFGKIQQGVQPTIKSLQNLYNNGLKKVGSFVWDSAKDFLTEFLAPVAEWTMGEGLPRFIDALNDGLMKIDWDKIQEKLKKLWQALEPLAVHVGEGLLWFWENVLVPFGVWVANEFVTRFIDLLAIGVRALDVAIKAGQKAFQWLWEKFLQPIASWTADKFVKYWDLILAAFDGLVSFFEDLPSGWKKLKESVSDIWESIYNTVKLKVEALKEFVGKKFKSISTAVGDTWTSIKNGISKAWTAAKDSVQSKLLEVADKVKKNFKDRFEKIKDSVTNIWTSVKNGIAKAWTAKDSIQSKLLETATTIKKNFSDRFGKIKDTVTSTWTSIKNGVSKAWTSARDSVWSAISNGISTIKTKSSEKFKSFKEMVSGVWTSVKNKASSSWETGRDSIKSVISGAVSRISGAFDGFKSKVKDAFTAPSLSRAWSDVKRTLTDIFDKIGKTASDMRSTVSGAFGRLFSGVLDVIKDPFNAVARVINRMIEGVVYAVNSMFKALNKLSFTVPSWIPGIGGKRFGFNFSEIKTYPQIPLLAKGAVIPPNAPFMAMLGDQKKGNNIETPESLLRQIVREESGNGNGNYTFIAELDGNVIFKKVIKKAQLQRTQTGRNPFELAMG